MNGSGAVLATRISAVFLLCTLMITSGCSLFQNPSSIKEGIDGPAPGYYQNPLLKHAPDPSVFKASDGTYYAYPTGGNKFEAYSSHDLVHWKGEGVVLSGKELKWAHNKFWAPEVIEHKGQYYMFFSAAAADGVPKISAAVSGSPKGPFTHPSEKPLFDFGFGSIDPFVFKDEDGKAYLYFTKTLFAVDTHKDGLRIQKRVVHGSNWNGEKPEKFPTFCFMTAQKRAGQSCPASFT